MNRISQFGLINAYLVDEGDALTLVDTGMTGNAKRIVAAAATLGKPITTIAITHAHDDHVGSLDALVAQLPGVEVVISTRDARLLAGDKSLDPGEPQGKLKGGLKGAKTKPTRTVEPGERIGSLEVHAAPGHTPGQVAFLDTRDRSLYCGDSYATIGGIATCAKGKAIFPLPSLATWDKGLAVETAKALRALDPARLAPGHGKVVEAPAAGMDAAIARGK